MSVLFHIPDDGNGPILSSAEHVKSEDDEMEEEEVDETEGFEESNLTGSGLGLGSIFVS